ncbi:PREDICTED: trihelix transcription factor ASIL2 [Tarenaya hassleriana]|uniref:trihelix transcription factor ASIL2 n=1 Tax=Tarenaya hassleriana TaxID=28532 RepID=UPI00053C399B|nr:PREDICTED: trihelix transcription factor ASIL2 [Tarenaya hassleriana]
MDDVDEIRSQPSPAASGSPDQLSTPPVGRITVTVASTGPPPYSPVSLSRQDANALALTLPVQASGGGGGGCSSNGRDGGGGGGREDCWSEGATAVLIDAWGERYLELSRGNLKQQHWKEVAEIVSSREVYGKTPKTDIQCKNRIDTVKKKYKQEKARMSAGGGPSRWVFFEKLDRLIGSTTKIPTSSPSGGGGGSSNKIPMGIPMSSRSNLYRQGKVTPPPMSVDKLDRLIGATTRIHTASLGGGGGGSPNVAMGIPMSNRSNPFQPQGRTPLQQGIVKRNSESKRWHFRKRNAVDSDSESETEMSADSADSLPPPPLTKRLKTEKKKDSGGGEANKWMELTRAILRLGEAYEQAETTKLQQVVEMEKERMKFLKDLELQRMQFFMKTQLEITQLGQHGRRNGGGGGGMGNTSKDHSSKNNNIAAINNNSDVSN